MKVENNYNTVNEGFNNDTTFFKPTTGIQFNSMNANDEFNTEIKGFVPSGSFGFTGQESLSPGERDLDELNEEERERLAQIELEQEERKRKLYEKSV